MSKQMEKSALGNKSSGVIWGSPRKSTYRSMNAVSAVTITRDSMHSPFIVPHQAFLFPDILSIILPSFRS